MKQTKRILSLILSLVMLLSISAGLDFSSYAYVSGDWKYYIDYNYDYDDYRIILTDYLGNDEDLVIPSKIYGYTVIGMEMCTLPTDNRIRSVSIPSTFEFIPTDDGFNYCNNLVDIKVDKDNKYYSSKNGVLFDKNKKELICYPRAKKEIIYAVPQGVVYIYDAFRGCKYLESIVIPKSVKHISWCAIDNTKKLKEIYYTGSKSSWKKIHISEDYGIREKGKIDTIKVIYNYNGPKDKIVKLSKSSYTYDGKAEKPSVIVKDSKGKKIDKKYYTISYSKGRKNVGKYTVTIKFKGNYSGTVKKTFTIKPKSTIVLKLTAGKNSFTIKWKKQKTQTTGYQIQYATDSKFAKNKKTVTVSKNKTTSKKISKLSSKKKYYVRIRTYKTVKVNGKSTKIYSNWSKAKSAKTK